MSGGRAECTKERPCPAPPARQAPTLARQSPPALVQEEAATPQLGLHTTPRMLLQRPSLAGEAASRTLGLTPRLHLDPQIEAQMQAIAAMRQTVSPAVILPQVQSLPLLIPPRLPPNANLGLTPPWLTPAPSPAAGSAVPQTLQNPAAAPESPREGSAGDILKAVLKMPQVQTGLDNLGNEAERQLRLGWRQSNTGERTLMVSLTVLLVGGAVGNVLANSETRQFVLEQLKDKPVDVPGTPLTLQLNLTDPNKYVLMTLDIGGWLPAAWGFGRKE